jgi:hypothetical protein
MASGTLACAVLQQAGRDGIEHAVVSRITARLRAGVPVDRDLAVTITAADGGYAVTLRDGDTELMTAAAEIVSGARAFGRGDAIGGAPEEWAAEVTGLAALAVPEAPPFFEETGEHPIPGCFSCGPENPTGLHIYPRVVRDGVTCAAWPDASAFDNGGRRPDGAAGEGLLAAGVLTSAIDCSGGVCLPVAQQRELLELDQFFLLGTMDVRYLRVAPSGAPYRVAAKHLRRDGRKFYGLSVLAGEDGTAYAMAETTWIVAGVSRTVAFGGR